MLMFWSSRGISEWGMGAFPSADDRVQVSLGVYKTQWLKKMADADVVMKKSKYSPNEVKQQADKACSRMKVY